MPGYSIKDSREAAVSSLDSFGTVIGQRTTPVTKRQTLRALCRNVLAVQGNYQHDVESFTAAKELLS